MAPLTSRGSFESLGALVAPLSSRELSQDARGFLRIEARAESDDEAATDFQIDTRSSESHQLYRRVTVAAALLFALACCVALKLHRTEGGDVTKLSGGVPVAQAIESTRLFESQEAAVMQGNGGDPNLGETEEEEDVLSMSSSTDLIPPKPAVWQQMNNQVVADEGPTIAEFRGDTVACRNACDENPECASYSSCKGGEPYVCHLKSKSVTGNEPRVDNRWCRSNFKSDEYWPYDNELKTPSANAAHTFYMYRVQGPGDFYPPGNVNAGTIGGVLWYLHNEVIKTCSGEGFMASGGEWGDRKFQIDRIRRMKVTYKPPKPLTDKGMKFGVLQSFDSGETTGPHRHSDEFGPGSGWKSTAEWNQFGFHIGCGKIGEWPHADEMWSSGLSYPNCTWWSLAGPCPQMTYTTANTQCNVQYPGGLCSKATGQGNCTFSFEEAGYIMIDHLVGISDKWSDRKHFCEKCKTEGGPWWSGGCGFDWWGGNVWTDVAGNANREKLALQAFEAKYPDMPKETTGEISPPICDFNKAAYGFA